MVLLILHGLYKSVQTCQNKSEYKVDVTVELYTGVYDTEYFFIVLYGGYEQ